MAGSIFATSLLLAGLLVLGYTQQYETEPSRVWQPSRVQRTQNPSLFGNGQSSPQFSKRPAVQERYQVQSGRNIVPETQDRNEFNQQRLRPQSSRGRSSSRRGQQEFEESPSFQRQIPGVNSERSNPVKPAAQEARNRFQSRNLGDSNESTLFMSLGDLRTQPPPQRTSSFEDTSPISEDRRTLRKNQQIESFPRRGNNDARASNVEQPRSRSTLQSRPSVAPQSLERSPGSVRTSPRRAGLRGSEPVKQEIFESRLTKPVDNKRENEVLKTPRTRGRFSSSLGTTTTSEEPTIFETVVTERTKWRNTKSTTPASLETVQASNDPTYQETEPTERSTVRRFQKPSYSARSESSEEVKSTERTILRRFPQRSGSNLPAPSTSSAPQAPRRPQQFRPEPSRLSSRERTGVTGRVSSEEETIAPEQYGQTTLTTEGYTEVALNQNSQKATSRGRPRPTTTAPSFSGQKPISRGEKKAKLEITLKSDRDDDDISEEDNYPKEFIEKIKSSAEKSQETKVKSSPRPSVSGGRLGRSRPLQLQALRQPSKLRQTSTSTDSDVSESIHEDTFEQGLHAVVKPKEIPSYSRNRYFGKTKTTTTTSTTPEPTTKSTARTNQTSSVDVLRQRYLDKLKQSQEERQQKLANLRPKLIKDGVKPEPNKSFEPSGSGEILSIEEKTTTTRSYIKGSTSSFKPSSRFSRPTKNRFETKIQSTNIGTDTHSSVKFRPRFSLTQREPDSEIEPATPTVAEHARTRNRYSRLRKEELSVEAPEVKTSWTRPIDKPKRADSAYNFIRLRTKDLTPLASEDVMDIMINNEVLDVTTTSTGAPESSSMQITTVRQEETVVTETPAPTEIQSESSPATTVQSETISVNSSAEITTEAVMREATTLQDQVTLVMISTEAPEQKPETVLPSQQAIASTRHRFSSRYSTMPTPLPENSSTEMPTTEDETPASTLSILNLFTSSLSSDILSSTPTSEANSSITTETATPITTPATTTTTTPLPTTAKTVTTKKKQKPSKTTTVAPGFLENRPILRNLISLLSPPTTTTTTTKRPKTKSKPKSKLGKSKPKSTSTTTTTTSTTTTAPSTTTEVTNNTVSPLPLAVSAEEIINNTQEVINNSTFSGSDFGKVPRDELDALTPLPFINTTEATKTNESSQDIGQRAGIPSTTTEEMQNVTSQSVFFDYSSTTPRTTPKTVVTTPSTTTAGDYFVYGIYPNNTVVKKRAWKTFDYEKYMTPYVIFGIYPNNTVVRKFPNGTIINDEFMTSDNEIGDPSSSTTTTTTELPTSSTTTTELPSSTTTTTEAAESVETTEAETEVSTVPQNEEEDNDNENVTSPNDENAVTSLRNDEDNEDVTLSDIDEDLIDSISPSDNDENMDATTPETDEDTLVRSSSFTESSPSASTENSQIASTESSSSDPIISNDASESSPTTVGTPTTEDATLDPDFFRIFDGRDKTTPMTSTMRISEDTTVDPSVNQVLPLSFEEVQSLWNGNFSDSAGDKKLDSDVSSSFNINNNANLLSRGSQKAVTSITNIAFRALSTSTSGTSTTTQSTTTTRAREPTTEELTTIPEPTTRKPRIKFVTLTPGVMVTTDVQDEDSITLSSQHVQKVTKAPTQIPSDLLTSVFGSLEQKSSSPIPDILKDVEGEVGGDGLTAALARRIIALAMERAKSTTTESVATTTTFSTTTETPTTIAATTTKIVKATKAPKRKQSTRTTSKGPSSSAIDQQNAILSLPVGSDLQDVLQKLVLAQNLEAAAAAAVESSGSTTISAPADLEKTVENQIRLAEEVRKASRTMKKKKKKVRTTTPPPRPILGFLFNFFNRPSPTPLQELRTPKRLQSPSTSAEPDSQLVLLTSLPAVPGDALDGTPLPDASDSVDVQGERQTRGQLLTAAIDVTRAVSKFMGTVINNAAQSFQTFMRGGWGR